MARMCVDIVKIKAEKNICFYEVNTNDEGGAHFFIKVNKDTHRVCFYLSKELQHPIFSVDTDKEQEIRDIMGISKSILLHVIWRSAQVYQESNFPDSLSFCS